MTDTEKIDFSSFLKNLATFLSKHKSLLFVSFGIGLALGYYKTVKEIKDYVPHYQSRFFIQSPFLSDEEVFSSINNSPIFLHQNKVNATTEIKGANNISVECIRELFFDDKKPVPKVIITSNNIITEDSLKLIATQHILNNPKFIEAYNIEEQRIKELTSLNQQAKDSLKEGNQKALETLINEEAQLKKDLSLIENPIQLNQVNPLNELIAPRSKTLTILGTGIIISILIGFILFTISLFKPNK